MNNEEWIIVVSASPIIPENVIIARFLNPCPKGTPQLFTIHYSIFTKINPVFRVYRQSETSDSKVSEVLLL